MIRENFWFRLNVFPIHIPPLRQINSDIPALVHHCIDRKIKAFNLSEHPVISPGTMEQLIVHPWSIFFVLARVPWADWIELKCKHCLDSTGKWFASYRFFNTAPVVINGIICFIEDVFYIHIDVDSAYFITNLCI